MTVAAADVSVIIPAYNAARTIGRALESVAKQTAQPMEVIVVDDGSADGTAGVARACGAALNGIRLEVIEQPNKGAGAARNLALAAASGQIVAFLDADDEWLAGKLAASLQKLAEQPLVLVAHNGWIVSNGTATEIDIARRFQDSAADPLHGLYRRGYISTSSVVTYRDAVLNAGGFDEGLRTGQDFDLWLKMLCKPAAPYLVFADKLTRYHISSQGITGNTGRRLENTLQIALRHAPRLYRFSGRYIASLWFRVTALHLEAGRAFWKTKRYADALRVMALLPMKLVIFSVCALRSVRREASV